jgi:hypothetical protein
LNDHAASMTTAAQEADGPQRARLAVRRPHIGSLTRRMIGVAALWISVLLLTGGFALDRILTTSIVRNFDDQLTYVLNAMVAASEIGPDGEVRFNRPPADQRFIEPYSGVYFQVSGESADTFPSRSLWDRRLRVSTDDFNLQPNIYDSNEFAGEPLRIAERDIILPGSEVRWRFQVAQSREMIDSQITEVRSTLIWSFAALGAGLLVLAALQTIYGLWPLRRVQREVVAIRSGTKQRISDAFPTENERGQRDHPRPDAERDSADSGARRPPDRRRRQADAADADARGRRAGRLPGRAPSQARRRGRVHPHRHAAA